MSGKADTELVESVTGGEKKGERRSMRPGEKSKRSDVSAGLKQDPSEAVECEANRAEQASSLHLPAMPVPPSTPSTSRTTSM